MFVMGGFPPARIRLVLFLQVRCWPSTIIGLILGLFLLNCCTFSDPESEVAQGSVGGNQAAVGLGRPQVARQTGHAVAFNCLTFFVSILFQIFRKIAMSTYGLGPSRGILAKTGFWE